jgi:hypothetical protein
MPRDVRKHKYNFLRYCPVWMIDVDVLIYYPLHVLVSKWPSSEGSVCQHVGNYHYNVIYIHLDYMSYS